MMKKIAILQNSAQPDTATEALDLALSLASFDIPVQLILCGSAIDCLVKAPSKRYAMLELLDAEPIAICSSESVQPDASAGHTVAVSPAHIGDHLSQFNEVFQFS